MTVVNTVALLQPIFGKLKLNTIIEHLTFFFIFLSNKNYFYMQTLQAK